MVRWLRRKHYLSDINHKRFELGQDSCKGTEFRQRILYSDTLQKRMHLMQEYNLPPSSHLFLFKIIELFLLSITFAIFPWWRFDRWIWVMSVSADHVSLIGYLQAFGTAVAITLMTMWLC